MCRTGQLFRQAVPRKSDGLGGTITADAVVVRPGRFYGIRLAGPAGTFPIKQFQAVRVERIPNPDDIKIQRHERVCLIGTQGTPDILVARTDRDVGRTLGAELAAATKLPYEEQILPY